MNLRDIRGSVREKLNEEAKTCGCPSAGTGGYTTRTDCPGVCSSCCEGGWCITCSTGDAPPAGTTGGGGKKRPTTRGRTKEQTTAGAAGAYSQPLFGKPMKRSIKIKESTFIELLEKSVYSAIHGGVIKEALTDADERRIGVLARKELKDYEVKLEKKVDQMITKAFKGKEFEDKTLKITKNALIQLYKALWIRRSFWSEYIKNTPS